jgi:hypothetical protein
MLESIKKFIPQSFNDFLAVTLMLGIIILWVFVNLPAEVSGALIATWTLIVQYYFRKKSQEK